MYARDRDTGINTSTSLRNKRFPHSKRCYHFPQNKQQLAFNPNRVCSGTKVRLTARVAFKRKHRLFENTFHNGDLNEVYQAFSIQLLDVQVVYCLRQRRFNSCISKPSIMASTKGVHITARQSCLLNKNVV